MRHIKLKVEVLKDIDEPSNNRKYAAGEKIEVMTVKKESEFYKVDLGDDIDMIPKDSVKIYK